MKQIPSFRNLTDAALIAVVPRLAGSERKVTAHLVSALVEFERRRLHLALGYSSMFEYCVRFLHLSEHEAYNRIEAARAARRFPDLLLKLETGELSLTAIRLLAPHLTAANVDDVMRQALHGNTDHIKRLVARLHPQPPVPAVIRKLPEPKPVQLANEVLPTQAWAGSSAEQLDVRQSTTHPTPQSRRPMIAPLSESHYKLQVTISASARERLTQIQALMRHRLPSGDPAAIVEHALEVLHAELLKQKAAQVAKPRVGKHAAEAKGRYIPASVKREVWRRDCGRCAFVAPDGKRCGSEDGVEFHHVQPYAVGGESSVKNIEVRCRAHNGFEWERHLETETLALLAAERADSRR